MMIMWFLAPPKACTRLPLRAPPRVDVFGDRRRADEADRLDVGMVEDRVDRLLVAVDDVEDAGRQAGLHQQLGQCASARRRIALRRLQDEGVAAGDGRGGNIHIGTMAGKLNGVMPATTPSGWRIE
jgi:hypothetical protein